MDQPLVVFASVDQPATVQNRLVAWCSQDERERAARLVRGCVARERLVTRGLLRAVLGDHLGLRPEQVLVSRSASGKPQVAGTPDPVRFSLSHSAGLVAVCLHPRLEVGIDIEHRGRRLDIEALAGAVLPPEEAGSLLDDGAGRQDALLRWWTRREALGKGVGRGLDWRAVAGAGTWLTPAAPEGQWSVRDLPAPPGFVGAVAVAVAVAVAG